MERFQIRFSGRVQGVGFRYYMLMQADNYGCTGWVRNEYDGSVLCEIQGDSENIDMVVKKMLKRDYFIRAKVDEKIQLPLEKEKGFSIIY